MIGKDLYYNIADLQLEVVLPCEWDDARMLPTFAPFKAEQGTAVTSCSMYISTIDLDFDETSAKLLSDISIVWGDRFTFYETEEYYWTLIQYSADKSKHFKMRSAKDFRFNTVYFGDFDESKNSFLSWYCMVAFAQSALVHKCIMVHASVVVNNKIGYAFLGKSGTGKSTHSKLWVNHIPGFTLLNDDNPAVRIINNEVRVYGTPWSGKTKCYINDSKPLKGLVRLKQYSENIFTSLKNKDALIAILPSCSAIRWNLNLYNTLVNILIELLSMVSVGELKCLPNETAAQLCYTELKKLNI